MPRMMTAVLRLLVPTSAYNGQDQDRVSGKSSSIPVFLVLPPADLTLARNEITAGFANSDG